MHTLAGDLGDDAIAREIVTWAARKMGGLDFMWNQAGHTGTGDLEGMEREVYDWVMDLTLCAAEAAMPHLGARGGGSLLFTSSTSGLRASARAPPYIAPKFSVTVLVKSASAELFVSSDEASYISGAALPVDGAVTA